MLGGQELEVLQAGFWFQFLIAVGSYLISDLIRPKPSFEDARPKGLGDIDFPTATEGRPVPLVWGTVQLKAPNLVWYGDFRAAPITETHRTGIFSSDEQTIGFHYAVGMQMALCRGPVDQLRRIWVGEKLLWDDVVSDTASFDIDEFSFWGGTQVGGTGGIVGTLDFHKGSNTQTPNTYLQGFQTPDTPGYVGTCYLVWRGASEGERVRFFDYNGINFTAETVPVGYFSTTPSLKPWKFEVRRTPNGLGLTGGKEIVNGNDANPANVVYEILTNTEWGLGLPPGDIDTSNLIATGNTLYDEGNGFSYVLDREISVGDLIDEIERQIDGVVFIDPTTGLWKITLARGGYSIGSLFVVDDDNTVDVRDDKESTFDDAIGTLYVKFWMRDTTAQDYKETHAVAHDSGTIAQQGGLAEAITIDYPGVKEPALAAKIATRDLRSRARPLKRADIDVDRSAQAVAPGQVFAWTNTKRGISQLPMRVLNVSRGTLEDGRLTLHAVEDVYYNLDAMFDAPTDTEWTPPSQTLVAIPTDEDQIFEMPLAFARRDPSQPGVIDRLWAGARYQADGASTVRIYQRNSSGTPTGDFALDGEIFQFIKIGTLNTTVPQNTTNPTTSTTQDIKVDKTPDSIETLLSPSATLGDLGQDLVNLIMIEDEILAVTTVIDATTRWDLRTVYRGFLDSAAREHTARADVFALAGSSGTAVIPRANNVDVQLRSRSMLGELAEGDANTVALTMNDRARRPYPASELTIEGTRYPTGTVSLDSTTALGSGDDQQGFDVTFRRRDNRIFDEVTSVLNDGSALDGGWPASVTGEYRLLVIDSSGVDVQLFFTPWAAAAAAVVTRTEVLAYTDGEVPTQMIVEIQARHTYESEVFTSTQVEQWEFNTDSAELAGLDNTGARLVNTYSAAFTANETGTYTFTIANDLLTSGALEVRLNGGSPAVVISSGGGSSGTLSITAGDSVEWRHTQAGAGTTQTLLKITAPSVTLEAYGILRV